MPRNGNQLRFHLHPVLDMGQLPLHICAKLRQTHGLSTTIIGGPMTDPYKTLNISKLASEKDVKSAFRKLAKAYHPDQNPDDPSAQDKFAKVNSAYELLSNKEKRGQFDRGEIDAAGNPKGFDFSSMGGGRGRAGGGINPEDILKEFMGGGRAQRGGFGGGGAAGFDPFGGGMGRGAPARARILWPPYSSPLSRHKRQVWCRSNSPVGAF